MTRGPRGAGTHEGRPYDRWVGATLVVALSAVARPYAINRCTSAVSLEYVNSASWVARVTPT
jgi:hypothetical protein